MKIENQVLEEVYNRDIVNGTITIPSSIHAISNFAFSDISQLKHIIIPQNVAIVEKSAFEYCENLERVEFKNPNTIIGEFAFSCCSNLKNIILLLHISNVGLLKIAVN